MISYNHIHTLILFGTFLLLSSCSPSPEAIEFGRDQCTYCKMIISDRRYGAEIVTVKGKIHTFDSVECLAASLLRETVDRADIHSLLVIDFNQPGTFTDARSAVYLHSEDLKSPMGLHLTAFDHSVSGNELKTRYTGQILEWDEVIQLVAKNWSVTH